MASQRDIAKRLGLSQMTVSWALNAPSTVSSETRGKVLKEAKAIGYKVNPYVSSWMAQRRANRAIESAQKHQHQKIAFIYTSPLPIDDFGDIPEIKVMYEAYLTLQEKLREKGFRLEPFNLGDTSGSSSKLNRTLLNRGIKGIILGGSNSPHIRLNFNWKRFCITAKALHFDGQYFDRVCHDGHTSMQLACQRMQQLGYQRVGLCIEKFSNEASGRRWSAAFIDEQLRTSGQTFIPPLEYETWNETAFWDWYEQYKPTAIVGIPIDLTPILAKRNLRVPEDVGLCFFNVSSTSKHWSGIDMLPEKLGELHAQLMIDKIVNNQCGLSYNPKRLFVTGRWNPGKTLRPQASNKKK